MQNPCKSSRWMLLDQRVDDQLANIPYPGNCLQHGSVLGQTISYNPMDLGPVHSSSLSTFLVVGRDSSHSSLPTFMRFRRLAPCGSSGEYFIGDTATIAAPHFGHLVPRPYSSHEVHLCSLVLTILSNRLHSEGSMKSMLAEDDSETFGRYRTLYRSHNVRGCLLRCFPD